MIAAAGHRATTQVHDFWNINHLPIDIISYIMSQIPRVVDRGNEEAGGKISINTAH